MATTVKDQPGTMKIEPNEKAQKSANTLTILFTELMDLAALINFHGNSAAGEVIQFHEDLTASIIEKHAGKVVKKTGGSVMAEFWEPASAVKAGMEMERVLHESNLNLPQDQQLQLRIGIHASPDDSQGIELFGNVLNGAVRVAKQASPMQILISNAVYAALPTATNLRCRWLNNVAIDDQTKEDVFEVNWAEAPANIPSRYDALSQVGAGGMGIVYKVRDKETGEIVALKILKPGIASDAVMQENLKREVCLARKVTHKNVCRIHEFNRSNGAVCISMEFIEGESLQSRLRRAGALPLNQALEIMQQICAGLREAHLQGIVHRDLKPANIMLDRSGSVKIMDFGIARSFQGNTHTTRTITGTPEYMAPEQLELKPVGACTDIYALGLLLYEMVTGVSVFFGDTPVAVALKQLREVPKRPREIVPTLPAHIEDAILRCLQKEPAKRFQSLDELAQSLKKKVEVRHAAPWWVSLAPAARRAEQEVNKILRVSRVEAEKAILFLRTKEWSMAKLRKQPAFAAGLAIVLAGSVAFAVGSSRKSYAPVLASAAPMAMPVRGGVAPVPDPSSISDSSGPNDASTNSSDGSSTLPADGNAGTAVAEVNLNQGSGVDAQMTSPSSTDTPKDSAKPDSLANPKEQKAQLRAPHSATAPARTTLAQSKLQPSSAVSAHAAKPAAVTPATFVVPVGSTRESGLSDGNSGSQPSSATPVAPVAEAKPASVTGTQPSTSAKPDPSISYLEVGSFKDSAWADSAVEKLTQLGFHAVSVHKTKLWVQSFHVQVGPYSTPKDIEMAQHSLALQGFAAHVVK
jgi:serine/threonine protein kinase/class 3 adenylate cyclase